MTKNHLKRLAAPKAWNILRKENTFITRPNPGRHSLATGIPVVVLLRDMLHAVDTVKEARHILLGNEVTLNGKPIRDHRMAVGLMDVIEFPKLKKAYRVVLNRKGKLVAIESKDNSYLTKIVGKKKISGGKIQLRLLDGSVLLLDKGDYKTGDSVVVEKNAIKSHFALAPKVPIFLTGGKHIGDSGTVEDIVGTKILYKNKEKEVVETSKSFAFVMGDKKPLITIE